jgi:hypothetical protein
MTNTRRYDGRVHKRAPAPLAFRGAVCPSCGLEACEPLAIRHLLTCPHLDDFRTPNVILQLAQRFSVRTEQLRNANPIYLMYGMEAPYRFSGEPMFKIGTTHCNLEQRASSRRGQFRWMFPYTPYSFGFISKDFTRGSCSLETQIRWLCRDRFVGDYLSKTEWTSEFFARMAAEFPVGPTVELLRIHRPELLRPNRPRSSPRAGPNRRSTVMAGGRFSIAGE